MSKQNKKAKANSEAKGYIANQEVVVARRLPDGKSEMTAFLSRGKEVIILGSEGDYYKVAAHIECFVPKRFVELANSEPQAEPEPEEAPKEEVKEAEGE
ncbi:hypothetical protein [Methanobrevibacter sp.]|uniref:hypothetical protein n=1 Tax=Methanobrevibacter sp. TaxID=66852 RepID=UPI00388D5EB3